MGSGVKRLAAGAGLIFALGLVALALVAWGGNGLSPVPRKLAGLPLTHALQGADAQREIDRLHKRRIPVRESAVAHYEGGTGVSMLYISQAYLEPLARWQLRRMVAGIRQGRQSAEGLFSHLKATDREGVTVYSALGMGQIHYFYRRGRTIVWVAADPGVARQALADSVRFIQ